MKVMVKQWKGPKFDWEVRVRVQHPDGQWLADTKRGFQGTRKQAHKHGEQIAYGMLQEAAQREEEAAAKKQKGKEAPTLAEFESRFVKEHLEANRLKPTTIATYKYRLKLHLVPKLGHLRLDQIDRAVVQQIKAEMKGQAASALNHTLGVLSKVLVFAWDIGVIESLPWRLKTVKVKMAVPEMEFHDFVEYARIVEAAGRTGDHDLALVLLGGDAGLRRGEIAALAWEDVDLRNAILTVCRTVYQGQVTLPKGGRSRKVPMTSRLITALKSIKPEDEEKATGRVLRRPDGSEHTETSINEAMPRITRSAGMKASRKVHILRHTFCSHLAMRGAAAIQIMTLAGHTDLKTTQRYMHLSPAMKDSAIRLLEQPIPEWAIGAPMPATESTKTAPNPGRILEEPAAA